MAQIGAPCFNVAQSDTLEVRTHESTKTKGPAFAVIALRDDEHRIQFQLYLYSPEQAEKVISAATEARDMLRKGSEEQP